MIGAMIGRMLKYQISSDTSLQVEVLMPEGAVIRAVGMQGGQVYAWAETPRGDVRMGLMVITRTFRVIPTGGDLLDGTYLGTVFDGPYVWHIYEVAS